LQNVENATADNTAVLSKIRAHWLARLAHDLRGPLFAARGYTKLMLDERAGVVTVTQRRYLETIQENIERLTQLANSLQDFPSEGALQLEVVNIGDLLRAAADSERGRDETLRFVETIPDNPILTVGDRTKLAQAVHELLGATVEISRSGGEVYLEVRQEDEEVTVRFSAISRLAESERTNPDISRPCVMLRLHGGVAAMDTDREGHCRVTIRLPLVAPLSLAEGK
jgi:signal transduction histidine kinase